MFSAKLMIRTDNRPLEETPNVLNGVDVDVAKNTLDVAVTDSG